MGSISDSLRATGCIIVNKNLISCFGLNAAICFSELLARFDYFQARGQLQADGSFYNTVEDLALGTGLQERAQRTALRRLEKLGLIKTMVRGMPARRYFWINQDEAIVTGYLSQGAKLIQMKKETRPAVICPLPALAGTVPADGAANPTSSIIPENETEPNVPSAETETEAVSFEVWGIIEYYFSEYQRRLGRAHPRLKPDQFHRVTSVLADFMDTYDIDGVSMEETVDQFFNSNIATDFNINHFATEGILLNRCFELSLHPSQ